MLSLNRFLILFLQIMLFSCLIFCINIKACENVNIEIISFSNINGAIIKDYEEDNIVEASKLISYIKNETLEKNNNIIISMGNNYDKKNYLNNSTILNYETKSKITADMMNLIKADCELFQESERQYNLSKEKKLIIPILSANTYSKKTNKILEGIKDYIIKDCNGVKIAIIGLNVPDFNIRDNKNENFQIYYKNIINTAKEYVEELSKKNVDIIILATNLISIFDENKVSLYPNFEELAYIKNVNAIITKDSYILDNYENNKNISREINNVPIIGNFSNGSAFGKLEINYDVNNKNIISLNSSLIYNKDNVANNKKMEEIINNYIKQININLNKEICEIKDNIDFHFDGFKYNNNYSIEEFMASFVKNVAFADVSFIDSQEINNNLKKGKITLKDIYNITSPYNKIDIYEMTGLDLENFINMFINNRQKTWEKSYKGIFINYKNKNEKNIVDRITLENKDEIKKDKVYKVAISSSFSDDNKIFNCLENIKYLKSINNIIEEIKNYLEKEKF